MDIAHRLRRLRLERGMTQKELAQPAYTDAYVSTIEAGKRQPSADAVEHFARRLNVSVEQLASGFDPEAEAQIALELQLARVTISEGKTDAARQALKKLERKAHKASSNRLRARAVWGVAMCDEREGRLEEAISLYERAEDILSTLPASVSVEPLVGRARCLIMTGDLRYAIYVLEGRLDELDRQKIADPDSMVRLYSTLVAAYFESGLYAKAAAAGDRALQLAPQAENPETVAHMNLNVARILLHRSAVDEAKELLGKAEALYGQLELRDQLGKAHFARGFLLSREGQLKEARNELEIAAQTLHDVQSPVEHSRVLVELARLERLEGDSRKGEELATSAIEALGDLDPAELGQAHRELAQCIVAHDFKRAEKSLRLAIELFDRAEESVELAMTYRVLGDLFSHRQEFDAARDAYRIGIVSLEERL